MDDFKNRHQCGINGHLQSVTGSGSVFGAFWRWGVWWFVHVAVRFHATGPEGRGEPKVPFRAGPREPVRRWGDARFQSLKRIFWCRQRDFFQSKRGFSVPNARAADNRGVRHTPSPRNQPSAEQVFEVLTLQNAEPLLAFIRSMIRNEALVDDVFQETMLIAWRRLDDYDRERPFGPWLRGIAHKVALAQFRKLGRERPVEASVVEALEHKICEIEKDVVDGARMPGSALKDCVSRLPAAFRDAIEITYRGDRSVAQAATAADVGVEAMKKRLQRARAMLADCLRGKGVFA